jgi:hypothetical protein
MCYSDKRPDKSEFSMMSVKMKKLPLAAASVILVVAAGAAIAQYTPGSGGYSQPGIPSVPAPAQNPVYSWQQDQPQYQAPGGQPAYPQQQPAYGQQAGYGQPAQPAYGQPAAPVYVPQLSDAQLGDLTSSIALYPDPLLAQMLPGATYVQELTFADKWLAQHPGADDYTISRLPLQEPVKALMHYPTVLSMLTDHLDWTQALGVAFTYQQGDVMSAVQRWRLQAVVVGNLVSSPQQQVVVQGNMISIVPPPMTQVVYVPVYDPQVVYVRPVRPERRDVITFSAGGLSIRWMDNDVDWRRREVRVPVRHDWDDRGGWDGRRGGSGSDDRGGDNRGGGDRGGDRGNGRGGRGAGSDVVVTPGGRGGETVVVKPGRGSTTVVVPSQVQPPVKPGQIAPVGGFQGGGGAGDRRTFVREQPRPLMVYPDKIVTPSDKKVLTVNGQGSATQPGRGNQGRGHGRDD